MVDSWISPIPHMQGLTLLSTFLLQNGAHLSTTYGGENTEDGVTWVTGLSLNLKVYAKRYL